MSVLAWIVLTGFGISAIALVGSISLLMKKATLAERRDRYGEEFAEMDGAWRRSPGGGRRLDSAVAETNGRALVQFLRSVPGDKHLCLEEGTQSAWLYEVLQGHVNEQVVTHARAGRR